MSFLVNSITCSIDRYIRMLPSIVYRIREYCIEIGTEMLERFAEACAGVGTVEKKPKLEGRQMSIFITPS